VPTTHHAPARDLRVRASAILAAILPRPCGILEVRRQQLRIMNGQAPQGLLVNVCVAITLGWSLMTPGTKLIHLLWILASLILSGARYLDCRIHREQGLNREQMARMERNILWGATLQGILWGVAGTVLLPGAPVQQIYLIAVISGMTAGAVIILSPIWPTYVLFAIPTILPLSCRLMAGELLSQRLTGFLGMVYGLVMIIMAARVSRWLESSLVSAHENDHLTRHLQTANADLVEYRAQLEAAVVARTRELSEANSQLQKEIAAKEEERVKAEEGEEAVRRAQKLESLGVLAGGIAHDFNNLLGAVLGNLNLLQLKTPADTPEQLLLANMEKAINRAANLTKQMLAYSGKGHFVTRHLDLNLVVLELTSLLEACISKRTLLHLDLGRDLVSVFGDQAQLQQVVMNLVTNASESLDGKDGEIRISTRVQDLDGVAAARASRVVPTRPGPHVVLEVSDNGQGMTPEVQARIFDPFFTTKASGRGLGLSAMLGILRGHGAGIEILSEPQRGSTFRVLFPAAGVLPDRDEPAPAPTQVRFSGQVLVVDDEPGILEAAGAMLESFGLQVATAPDGVQAMEFMATGGADVKLVLLDLTMPRMDGRQTLQALRQLHPTLPVILSSGYDPHLSPEGRQVIDPRAFLRKPYTRLDLQRTLTEALGPNPVLLNSF
jgi:signal transduction histidine kinase/CheY-like chemotaxis protein